MAKLFGHSLSRSLRVLLIVEVLVLILSVEAGAALRLWIGGLDPWSMAYSLWNIAIFTFVCFLSLSAFGLYERECCRDLKMTSQRLIVALGAAMAVMATVFYFLPELNIWRSITLYSLGVAFFLLLIVRRIFIAVADLDRFKRPILVLGSGDTAAEIGRLADEHNAHGFRVVNFVRMSDQDPVVSDFVDRKNWDDILSIATTFGAQEVVLAMRERRGGLPIRELLACKMAGIRITDLSTFLERETGRLDLDALQPSWLVFSEGFEMSVGINKVLKRLFDIAASLLLIFFSIWVLLPTALLIRLTSPGPIFYRQERVGQNGIPFELYKFRSMRNDAEKDGTPQWAQAGDPRVTTVGRVIRATRIDEIPQILNVLRGEMSFVGPRPERPFFVDQLREEVPYFDERHEVKPGITGWAQINYPYGASLEDARKKLEYDLYYVKNFTVLLDFAILVQTVKVVVWQNGVR